MSNVVAVVYKNDEEIGSLEDFQIALIIDTFDTLIEEMKSSLNDEMNETDRSIIEESIRSHESVIQLLS